MRSRKTPFVAGFIGENNRLYGQIAGRNGESCSVQLDGGVTIQALPVNIGGDGARTTVSLRPERVKVFPEEGEFPNIAEAQVEELIYLGDHIRTRINLAGNNEFIVKIPNSDDHAQLSEGDTVTVGWAMEDCRALDA